MQHVLKIVDRMPAQRAEWEAMARQCGYATYFHTPQWCETFCTYLGGGSRPAAVKVVFGDGKSAIVVAVEQRRMAGTVRMQQSSGAGTFGGWIAQDALSTEHAGLLSGELLCRGNLLWRENPYDPVLCRVEIPGARDDFTQAADLRGGFGAVYAKFSRGHVNAVNKARRLGVVVRRGEALDDWRRHYESYRRLRERWRRATSDYRWKLFEMLHGQQGPNVALWVAHKGDEVLSSVVCFYWNAHAVAWHAGASAQRFGVRANHLMYCEIMRDACERGFGWFDMNPSGGNEGVAKFKQGLGMEKLRSRVVFRRAGLYGLLGFLRRGEARLYRLLRRR